MSTHKIFPVTRVHEPMMLELTINNGVVADAKVSGLLFRGFELMLKGRDPRDAIFFTQRICGICSTAHGISAVYALEDACGIQPTPNGLLVRNIIYAADILQNHLRHFYILTLPDYMEGPNNAPFIPKFKPTDYRLPINVNSKLLDNYWQGADLAAKAHQLLAIWGAKAPHEQCIYPTGVSSSIDSEKINMSLAIVDEITEFVNQHYVNDVNTIAKYYSDYYEMGKGYGNLISYGLFPQHGKENFFFPSGLVKASAKEIIKLNPEKITEEVQFSWYKDDETNRKPIDGKTEPDMEKEEAYSWVKAPRYNDLPFEGGPLARLWLKGIYQNGISTMDRIVARALETQLIAKAVKDWLMMLSPDSPTIEKYDMPDNGVGVGLTDAMRGPLGHWLKIEDGKIAHYQIVTPTAWNFSPKDNKSQRGPAEKSLIGLEVKDPENSIEAARVIHSYDPCFSCAIHLISDNKLKKYVIA